MAIRGRNIPVRFLYLSVLGGEGAGCQTALVAQRVRSVAVQAT
jgi:hypothetical protein